MAVVLDLRRKPFRVPGLRANENPYASLHRMRPKEALSTAEICAPPLDSSDEASVTEVEGDTNDVLTDRSIGDTAHAKTEGTPEREPSNVEAALDDVDPYQNTNDIVPTTWTSQKKSGSCSGSQASQKRKKTCLEGEDDDDMMGSFSSYGSKKRKPGYRSGGSSQPQPLNIFKEGKTKVFKKTIKKEASESVKVLENGFKLPKTDAMLSSVDKHEEKAKGPTWQQPPSSVVYTESQASSVRSSASTQESTRGSAKTSFRKPPPLPPQEMTVPGAKSAPRFRNVQSASETGGTRRSTRSSGPVKPASPFTKEPALKESFDSVTDKLGLPEVPLGQIHSVDAESDLPTTTLDVDLLDRLDEDASRPNRNVPEDSSSVCPWCKKSVDRAFLEESTVVGERLSLRQQADICRAHTQRSAKLEWFKMGYPNIDWANLNNRISQYHNRIDDILQRRHESFYRNVFEDSSKKAKDRNLKQTLMNGGSIDDICTGYYGTRGANIMMENIMSRFASKIRRLSASDKLISSGGVSGFVQAVLVPEVTVLLVQDDMGIEDEEEARTVLRNSADIGRILNEEEDEIIQDPNSAEEHLQS